MDRDSLVGTIVLVYIAAAAAYVGWRLAMRTVRQDSELAQLRERVWQLEEVRRAARAAAAAEEGSTHAS